MKIDPIEAVQDTVRVDVVSNAEEEVVMGGEELEDCRVGESG